MRYKLLFQNPYREVEFLHPGEVRALVFAAGFPNIRVWAKCDGMWDELPPQGVQALFMGSDG